MRDVSRAAAVDNTQVLCMNVSCGNHTESNPASVYYNPGGIGLSKGTQLTLDLSFVWLLSGGKNWLIVDPQIIQLQVDQCCDVTGQ